MNRLVGTSVWEKNRPEISDIDLVIPNLPQRSPIRSAVAFARVKMNEILAWGARNPGFARAAAIGIAAGIAAVVTEGTHLLAAEPKDLVDHALPKAPPAYGAETLVAQGDAHADSSSFVNTPSVPDHLIPSPEAHLTPEQLDHLQELRRQIPGLLEEYRAATERSFDARPDMAKESHEVFFGQNGLWYGIESEGMRLAERGNIKELETFIEQKTHHMNAMLEKTDEAESLEKWAHSVTGLVKTFWDESIWGKIVLIAGGTAVALWAPVRMYNDWRKKRAHTAS